MRVSINEYQTSIESRDVPPRNSPNSHCIPVKAKKPKNGLLR